MIIEIINTGFINKGAELMLHAVQQQIKSVLPETLIAMAPTTNDDYLLRAKLGLWQKVWLPKFNYQWGRLGRIIPQKLRRRYGIVIDQEINVIFDASGFRYSDQWGEVYTIKMAKCVKMWKKQGTKVILLPQAVGPFTSPGIREAFSYILKHADLVFPRDELSYKYTTELVGKRDNVSLAPDFTNNVEGILPGEIQMFRNKYCFVPNFRMIDKTSGDVGKSYLNFCANCIRSFLKSGHTPFILIHATEGDYSLASEIVRETGEDITIIKETDPLKIKGIIGCCAGLVGSRFHALVSALSQGIPVFAVGWSHKYEMLLNDYGIANGCLNVDMSLEELEKEIEKLTNDTSRKEIVKKINTSVCYHKQRTNEMWSKVFKVIRN